MRPFALPLALAAALLTTACAVGPDYRRPEMKLTPGWQTDLAAQRGRVAAPVDAWWTGFDDPELVRVVDRALAQNLDLAQARARVQASRAAARAAGAALLPRLDARGSAADGRQSLLTPIGRVGSRIPGYDRDYEAYDLGAAASWEIDLFGGLRREHEAARAEAAAAEAGAAGARITVAAEAADAYLQIRAFQGRLDVARRQIAVQQDLVGLIRQRAAQGLAAERELHQTLAALEGAQASLPPLEAGLAAQLNRLDVLMGAQPGTWRAELTAGSAMPAPPRLAQGDGPADLLRRRPDVLAAEQRLVAANARIGAAISDYYPKVSISALAGFSTLGGGRFFSGDAAQNQVAAGFGWRLFDFGRVDAEVAGAKGREAEALAAYRGTVLHAVEDVENAFSSLVQEERRADVLERQIADLTAARAQARAAYEGGALSLIEVLDADRDLLAASDQLVQARAGADRAAVTAYRALGGGWTPPATLAAHATGRAAD
ncbi:MAG: efflux transporter outer membrane subunit [Caulobacterales bacterium]|nr:efflux transporter outer membrane subunit [Caulobacterales bacterium]